MKTPEQTRPDLSVSIVDTDNRAQVLDCLRSTFGAQDALELEVFVVDNASRDGSREAIAAEFPQVRLLRNSERKGFSTNNNLALSQASGRYLMLLNDDTIVHAGALTRLVAFMDAHPEAGAAGSRLLNPDGSLQPSCFLFPRPILEAFQPLTDRWRVPRLSSSGPTEVDWVCGASLVVRREVADQVGLLDPAFDPIYSDDTDWCYRIKKQGGRVFYVPTSEIVHLGGQTMNRVPAGRVEMMWKKRVLFFRKHQGPRAAWTYKVSLWFSSLLKLAAWSGLLPFRAQRARGEIPLHWHMVKRALAL